jgi:RNA polymerase sigma-70 factor (ECF subfamily)
MPTDEDQDRWLMARFRDGDREALATIYRTHHPAVYRFALYMTNDPDSAAEVVQEAFVWFIDHPAAFDSARGSLPCFLSGVARKMLLRRKRDKQRMQPLADTPVRVNLDGAIEASRLHAAILELPADYRAVVVLCGIESRSYEEAATILQCAIGTVRSRLHRAKATLARKLMEVPTWTI